MQPSTTTYFRFFKNERHFSSFGIIVICKVSGFVNITGISSCMVDPYRKRFLGFWYVPLEGYLHRRSQPEYGTAVPCAKECLPKTSSDLALMPWWEIYTLL